MLATCTSARLAGLVPKAGLLRQWVCTQEQGCILLTMWAGGADLLTAVKRLLQRTVQSS